MTHDNRNHPATPIAVPLELEELHALDGLLSTALANPGDRTLITAFLPDWTDILIPLHEKISYLARLHGPTATPDP